MRRKIDIEVKAGIFIFAGLILTLATIIFISGGSNLFERTYTLHVKFSDVTGLARGATVRSGGLKIGRVADITFTPDNMIDVALLIGRNYQERVKVDSVVGLKTQGVLGDKYIEIMTDESRGETAKDGAMLPADTAKDLSAMLADGQNAMNLLKENLANLKLITGAFVKNGKSDAFFRDLTDAAANLKEVSRQMKNSNAVTEMAQTMKNLKAVTDKMKNGEGTIGALFNDSSLYEDLKSLIGGANRNKVLKFFVRQAVKSSDDAAAEEAAPPASTGRDPAKKDR